MLAKSSSAIRPLNEHPHKGEGRIGPSSFACLCMACRQGWDLDICNAFLAIRGTPDWGQDASDQILIALSASCMAVTISGVIMDL